ncbi:hypothetical protein [Streptomyces sp. NPDC056227]|uniref:hypothetical protein n=1 Tax=Streptomyces sp. NPDC056227 TaxID=3345753 RepID=UPI0035DA6DF1
MSDRQPGHYGQFANDADESMMRVHQDGQLLKETNYPSLRGLPVGATPATYRITLDTSRPARFPLSTRTSTAWTFKSARPTSAKENLALLWPQYGLDLDTENTTQGGSTYDFYLAFALQTGATLDVDGVEVEVSTDDGATWSTATVKAKSEGHYKVSLTNPSSGYVSLRVKAQDTGGSKVEQTLIKTYAVR